MRIPSLVAGILDCGGGFRVVVDKPHSLHHHVGLGERLFILPDYQVQEPVPVEQVPTLIKRVEAYIVANR